VWLLDIVPPVHTPYRPSATASRVAVHSLHYPLPQRTAISVSSTPLEIPGYHPPPQAEFLNPKGIVPHIAYNHPHYPAHPFAKLH